MNRLVLVLTLVFVVSGCEYEKARIGEVPDAGGEGEGTGEGEGEGSQEGEGEEEPIPDPLVEGDCSTGSLQAELLYRVDGPEEILGYGQGVLPLPDIDGDGRGDFAVTSMYHDFWERFWGNGVAVHSGRDGGLLYHIPGGLHIYANDAGDVDGDGLHDLLVPSDGGPGVFVFSGADGDQIHHLRGKPDGGLPVLAVGIGDIDADGLADIAVGDPTLGACHGEMGPRLCWEDPECDRWDDPGMVTIYSGAEGEVLHTLTGSEPGEGFGGALVVVGDVDLDDTPELAVSARPGDPCGEAWVESVYLYSMRDWNLVRRIDEVDGFGRSSGPFATGDVDGDGHADLGFWVEREEGPPDSLVVLSVVDGRTLTEWRPGPQGEPWGLGVGGLWDLDVDGAPDFLLGDWESRADRYWWPYSPVEIVSGATARSVLALEADDNAWAFGMGRAIGSDMDGDGRPDLLVSAARTRRVWAYDGDALLFWGSVWAYALRDCPRGKPSR